MCTQKQCLSNKWGWSADMQISQSLAYQVNLVNLLIELPCESRLGNTYKMGMQAIYKRGTADLWREKGVGSPYLGRNLPRNGRNNGPRILPSYTIYRMTLPEWLRSSANDVLKLCSEWFWSLCCSCVLPANAAPISDARVSWSLIKTHFAGAEEPLI